MNKIYRDLFIILGLFLITWALFSLIDYEDMDGPDQLLSLDQEANIGESMIESYLSTHTVIQSPYIDSCVFALKSRLESGIGTTDYDYKIYIIETEEVNAFASFDGHIVIFSGLIKQLNSPEELLSILSHEYGHIEHRHTVTNLVRQLGINIFLTIATGGDPALITEVMANAASSSFSRSQETEADEFALETLEKCQVNPIIMGTAFRRLKQLSDPGKNMLSEITFFDSHPAINRRIKMALNYKVKEKFKSKPIDIDWQRFQDEVIESPADTLDS